jgi:hypothetical protein
MISTLPTCTTRIIQLVNNGEITSSLAIRMLLKLSLKSETARDFGFIRVARETIEEIEKERQSNPS